MSASGLTTGEMVEELNKWAHMSTSGQAVSRSLMMRWHERRDRIGFPEPVGWRYGERGRPKLVWDPAEVLAWYLEWKPKKGGAPPGNQNGLKHGRRRRKPDGASGDLPGMPGPRQPDSGNPP